MRWSGARGTIGGVSKRGLVGLAAGVTPVRRGLRLCVGGAVREAAGRVSCVRYVTDSERDTLGGD